MSLSDLDFHNVTALCVTGSAARFPYLFATFSSILPNVKNLNVEILLNHEDELPPQAQLLEQLAHVTHNHLKFQRVNAALSVAQVKAQHITHHWLGRNFTWWFNVDDDFVFPYQTLDLICKAIASGKSDLYTYGVFDVLNTRNKGSVSSCKES